MTLEACVATRVILSVCGPCTFWTAATIKPRIPQTSRPSRHDRTYRKVDTHACTGSHESVNMFTSWSVLQSFRVCQPSRVCKTRIHSYRRSLACHRSASHLISLQCDYNKVCCATSVLYSALTSPEQACTLFYHAWHVKARVSL